MAKWSNVSTAVMDKIFKDVTKTRNGEWGMGNGEWGIGNSGQR